jgi:hypothetical protein
MQTNNMDLQMDGSLVQVGLNSLLLLLLLFE